MVKNIILAGLAALALTACRTTEVDLDGNPGSHGWRWFDDWLFDGTVQVYFVHSDKDRRNWWAAGAVYRAKDRTRLACYVDPESGEYRISTQPQVGPFMGWDADRMARWWDSSGDGRFTSVFFDPETGRFHTEYWNGHRWAFWIEGWLQESWPRSMAEACPDLELPEDLPINEAQTSRRMWHMMLQDPDAVLRNGTMKWNLPPGNRGKGERYMLKPYSWWQTYERRDLDPPPIGLPEVGETSAADEAIIEDLDRRLASPRAPAEAFVALVKANAGRILEDKLGRRYVVALNPAGDEIWALDENDDILDVGLIRFAEGLRFVDLQWETLPDARNYRHPVGAPLPVTVHDVRHPLFDLAAWIVERDRDIGLPFFGRDNVAFRLLPGGNLIARHLQGDIPGTWRLSRGRVVIEVEGIAELAGYQWRPLAHHLGWDPERA